MDTRSFFHSIIPNIHRAQEGRSFNGGSWKRPEECTEKSEWTAEAEGRREFMLDNANGKIVVEGAAHADKIKITAWKTVRAETNEEAKMHLADIDFDIRDGQEVYRAAACFSRREPGIEYRVDYRIELPETWPVRIESTNGDIRIAKMKNTLYVNVDNGTVEAADIAADVHVEVGNGTIQVGQALPENGVCELRAANGRIYLLLNRDASAVVHAGVASGSVYAGELGHASGTGGCNEFQCVLRDGKGKVNLSAVNGNITIGCI